MLELNKLRQRILNDEKIPPEEIRQAIVKMRLEREELLEKKASKKQATHQKSTAELDASLNAAFGHLKLEKKDGD